jgi:hypothetical protein
LVGSVGGTGEPIGVGVPFLLTHVEVLMYANVLVRLDLLGGLHGVPAEDLDPGVSPFTGRPLRRVLATVRVEGDAQHDRLTAVLSPGPDGEAVVSGEDGAEWTVTNRNVSYAGVGGPDTVYTHAFELEEREGLTLGRVEFGDLAIVPERWALDRGTGSPMTLTILASLDARQHQQFERFHGRDGDLYFDVTWAGIKDDPVRMRFGRCLWQEADDGGARHLVTFVAEAREDDADGKGLNFLFEPWQARLKEQSASHRGALLALLEELEQSGVLGAEAIARIKDKSSNLDLVQPRRSP